MRDINFNPIELVREFVEKFEAERAPWEKLIVEELDELYAEAQKIVKIGDGSLEVNEDEATDIAAALLKEYCDCLYVFAGAAIAQEKGLIGEARFQDMTLMATARDMVHDLFTPLQIREAFLEVHRSNMSKLGADGKPVRREDGKVIKGPNYSPANIHAILVPPTTSVN